jgi:peptidoglycan/LPS O-acetylase OafA/YrhL
MLRRRPEGQGKSAYRAKQQSLLLPERKDSFYHPELDGLRWFAFLAVFCHHSLPGTAEQWIQFGLSQTAGRIAAGAATAGAYGVDLFFALSGYLITELLLREQRLKGRANVKSFYVRRLLRIWPLYYLLIALSVLVVPWILPNESLPWRYLSLYALLGANWACVFWGFPQSVTGLMWSIGIEEQFYLVWAAVINRISARRTVIVAISLFGIASCMRAWLILIKAPFAALWCNTFTRVDPILGGIILALCLDGTSPKIDNWKRMGLLVSGVVGLVAVGRFMPLQAQPPQLTELLGYPLVAACAVAVLLSVLSDGTSIVSRVLSVRPLVFGGKISYGLYMYHILAIQLVYTYGKGSLGMVWSRVVALMVTCLFAIISYKYFEHPFLLLKEKYSEVKSRPIDN